MDKIVNKQTNKPLTCTGVNYLSLILYFSTLGLFNASPDVIKCTLRSIQWQLNRTHKELYRTPCKSHSWIRMCCSVGCL